MGQYYFARWRLLPVVCRRRLSGSVTLTAGGRTAAGRVGGRAADTLQCAVRATSCFMVTSRRWLANCRVATALGVSTKLLYVKPC